MHSSYVLLDGNGWSAPIEEEDGFHRSIARRSLAATADTPASGTAAFNLWFLYPESQYVAETEYRSAGATASLEIGRGEKVLTQVDLPPSEDWRRHRLSIRTTEHDVEAEPDSATETSVSRWHGAGGIVMSDVRITDESGEDRGVFTVGSTLRIEVTVRARQQGTFRVIPAALVFRLDGIVVTRHVGEPARLALADGEEVVARLDLSPLLLGNGTYLLSLGLYRKLDVADVEESEFYDYLDKSYEFQVVGNPVLHNELVRHPGSWSLVTREGGAPQPLRTLEAVAGDGPWQT